MDITTDSDRAFLSKLVSTYAGREKLGKQGLETHDRLDV